MYKRQPYDTLHGVIGLGQKEEVSGSLKDFGVQYEQLDLLEDGKVNYEGIPQAVKGAKVAYIQRSRGYSLRPSLFVEDIERIVGLVRSVNPEAIIMVDNCYGEFVQEKEPTQVGADPVSYTHLDVYKRQVRDCSGKVRIARFIKYYNILPKLQPGTYQNMEEKALNFGEKALERGSFGGMTEIFPNLFSKK